MRLLVLVLSLLLQGVLSYPAIIDIQASEKQIQLDTAGIDAETIEKKDETTEMDASDALTQGADELTQGMDALTQGTDELTQGMDALTQGTDELTQGMDALTQGTNEIFQGTDALTQGTDALTQGTEEDAENSEVEALGPGKSDDPNRKFLKSTAELIQQEKFFLYLQDGYVRRKIKENLCSLGQEEFCEKEDKMTEEEVIEVVENNAEEARSLMETEKKEKEKEGARFFYKTRKPTQKEKEIIKHIYKVKEEDAEEERSGQKARIFFKSRKPTMEEQDLIKLILKSSEEDVMVEEDVMEKVENTVSEEVEEKMMEKEGARFFYKTRKPTQKEKEIIKHIYKVKEEDAEEGRSGQKARIFFKSRKPTMEEQELIKLVLKSSEEDVVVEEDDVSDEEKDKATVTKSLIASKIFNTVSIKVGTLLCQLRIWCPDEDLDFV